MDDAILKALLAEDGLPDRDPAFRYAVMQGVARRRLIGELLDLAPMAAGAAAVLWALAPTAQQALSGVRLEASGPLLIAGVISLSLLIPMGLLKGRRA